MRHLDFALTLPGDMLVKVDRASMAVALEVRPLFLHRDVMELAAGLPRPTWRSPRREARLKAAVRPWLPDALIDRRKQGFAMPLPEWLEASSAGRARSAAPTPRRAISALLDVDKVTELGAAHARGAGNFTSIVHSTFMLDRWCARWLPTRHLLRPESPQMKQVFRKTSLRSCLRRPHGGRPSNEDSLTDCSVTRRFEAKLRYWSLEIRLMSRGPSPRSASAADVGIYFDPPTHHLLRDRLFDRESNPFAGDDILAPYAALHHRLKASGIEARTADFLPDGPDGRRHILVSFGTPYRLVSDRSKKYAALARRRRCHPQRLFRHGMPERRAGPVRGAAGARKQLPPPVLLERCRRTAAVYPCAGRGPRISAGRSRSTGCTIICGLGRTGSSW